MLSNNEVPVGKLRQRVGRKRQAHTHGSPKNRRRSAKSSKRRKGISVGPTAVESPAQGVSRTPSTDKEGERAEEIDKGGEGDACTAEAPFPPPPPAADTVILCKGEQEATPADLFNLKRSNIRLGLTTYVCSMRTGPRRNPSARSPRSTAAQWFMARKDGLQGRVIGNQRRRQDRTLRNAVGKLLAIYGATTTTSVPTARSDMPANCSTEAAGAILIPNHHS
jgi:hypothetical protein